MGVMGNNGVRLRVVL